MPPDTLEFEEPIAVLLKEIEALSMLPQTPERLRSIESLRRRIDSIRDECLIGVLRCHRHMREARGSKTLSLQVLDLGIAIERMHLVADVALDGKARHGCAADRRQHRVR